MINFIMSLMLLATVIAVFLIIVYVFLYLVCDALDIKFKDTGLGKWLKKFLIEENPNGS